jgi:hypothetical protein
MISTRSNTWSASCKTVRKENRRPHLLNKSSNE